MFVANEKAVDARARRAARRCGLRAMKSRRGFIGDNNCGFMLVNDNDLFVAGERFDMSAEYVLDYCKEEHQHRRVHFARPLSFQTVEPARSSAYDRVMTQRFLLRSGC